MKKVVFECETVTPMFLAGADGVTPELRPPSIKGMMRFWWRASNSHFEIDKLRKNEEKKFGASDEKIGKSKINIQIMSNRLAIDEYFVLPHKETFRSKGISPNQKIAITLSCYDNISDYSDILTLSLLLGGLGKRARRGFGSVRILNIDRTPYNMDYKIEDILKLINSVGANIYNIEMNKISIEKNIIQDYPFVKEIQLGHEYSSWGELLKKIGMASHNCRDFSLGFAQDGKRLASPVYVSVFKNSNNKYQPIITTLNTVFENRAPINFNKQIAFKGMIL